MLTRLVFMLSYRGSLTKRSAIVGAHVFSKQLANKTCHMTSHGPHLSWTRVAVIFTYILINAIHRAQQLIWLNKSCHIIIIKIVTIKPTRLFMNTKSIFACIYRLESLDSWWLTLSAKKGKQNLQRASVSAKRTRWKLVWIRAVRGQFVFSVLLWCLLLVLRITIQE